MLLSAIWSPYMTMIFVTANLIFYHVALCYSITVHTNIFATINFNILCSVDATCGLYDCKAPFYHWQHICQWRLPPSMPTSRWLLLLSILISYYVAYCYSTNCICRWFLLLKYLYHSYLHSTMHYISSTLIFFNSGNLSYCLFTLMITYLYADDLCYYQSYYSLI